MAVKLWYSAPEVARLTGLCAQTVRKWTKAGLIPGEWNGTRWVYPKVALDRWLAEQSQSEEVA